MIIMKEYTFRLYDNFLPNPNVIKEGNVIVNFKYCNLSELSWVDEEFNDNVFELPNWVCFFDVSYNSIYALYKGSSHDYKLPKDLTVLNLSFNKMDFIPDNVPNGLVALNVSNNTIKYLPKLPQSTKIVNAAHNTIKWFDQELAHLEKLNLSYNHISYFRFDRMRDNIRVLDLTGNQLKDIGGKVFPPNLEILKLRDNKISEIPKLPRNLIELDLSMNKIKKIDNFPSTLTILDVSSNNLEKLCDSVLHCKDMTKLNYEHNDSIEISLDVLIWIDKQFHMTHSIEKEINIKEIYSQNYEEIQTIYKDAQNAHNLKIRNDILKSMERIVIGETPKIEFIECCEKLGSYFKFEDTVSILKNSDIGQVELNGESYTLAKFFPYLYERIDANENKESLSSILENEIQNTKSVCFSGRIEAYVAALAGFDEDVKYSPSLSDQILAKIELIKNKLHKDRIPSDSLNYQVELKFYMEEALKDMNLDEETRKIWLQPIDDNVEEIVQTLEENYKKDIREIVDIIKMRKVIKQYFLQNYSKNS